ncbi:unnamed protein product [Boreogadus saida]
MVTALGYGQFVAGEDHRRTPSDPCCRRTSAFGVGSVLDYTAWRRTSARGRSRRTCCAHTFPPRGKTDTGADHRQGKHGMNEHAVWWRASRGLPVKPARTYLYADEAKCDRKRGDLPSKCIRAPGGGALEGFSAIKTTALARPQFLLRLSEVLVKWRRFFSFLAAQQGYGNREALEQKLELKRLQEFLSRLGAEEEGGTSTAGPLTPCRSSSGCNCIHHRYLNPPPRREMCSPKGSWWCLCWDRFTADEERQMKRTLQRVDVLAEHAEENGVRLMVDAEQTYLQPAISYLTLAMQRVYNGQKPLILNTYQCYLKEAFTTPSVDLERSRRQGSRPGGQGDLTQQEGQCDGGESQRGHPMNELGLAPAEEGKVSFGQLLGMCRPDQLPTGWSLESPRGGGAAAAVLPLRPPDSLHRGEPGASWREPSGRGSCCSLELKRRLGSGETFHRPAF